MRQADLARLAGVMLVLSLATWAAGCEGGRSEVPRVTVAGGDADRGRGVIDAIGCGACHVIPGIDGARGVVGPPLKDWTRRSYIAGKLPNSPDNLVRWVMNPHEVEPGTVMPDLDLSEQQARDVAAYLYTLD